MSFLPLLIAWERNNHRRPTLQENVRVFKIVGYFLLTVLVLFCLFFVLYSRS